MIKKLVYLSTSIIPSTQANSVQVMKMCNALCRDGFDVTLMAGTLQRNKNIDIFKYYGIENTFPIVRKVTGFHRGATFLLSIRYFPMLKKLAKSTQATIFYGRDVLGLYFLARLGRKVIYETHEIVKGPRKWAEEKLMENQNLSKIVFISNEIKMAYMEDYGELLSKKKLIVAPDASDEHPDFTQKVALTGQFDFNCCYIGGIYEGRGIGLILEVAKRLPDVGFHLFGSKVAEVNKFNKQSPANVYYYEYVAPSQTYKARNAVDVLLMPYQKKVSVSHSTSDTSRWMSPMKLFEYMASKKPIVSSDHKVLQEVLKDGHNALLCEPDNLSQWIDAISRLRRNKALYEKVSTTSYEEFLSKYTWDNRVKCILS